eukprot:gene8828-777_t
MNINDEEILKAIEVYEKVFGKNETYSNIETWKNRKLFKIFILNDQSFLAVEKRTEKNFHIWLMGSLIKGNGTKLLKELTNEIKKEKIEKITVSTFPNKWTIMYEWLKRIGFEEYKKIDDKTYLEIKSDKFIHYFCHE